MRAFQVGTTIVALLLGGSAAVAQEVTTTVGIRAWHNTWRGNDVAYSPTGIPVMTRFDNDPRTSGIPYANVRYRNFGIGGSYSTTAYSGSDGAHAASTRRKEYDLSLLYYFVPTASVSIGYKHVGWDNLRIAGLILAVSGSAPLQGNLGMYGTLAVGRPDARFKNVSAPDYQDPFKSHYTLSEVGFSYALTDLTKSPVAVTFGYRYQQISVFDIPIAGFKRRLVDAAGGPVVGVLASF